MQNNNNNSSVLSPALALTQQASQLKKAGQLAAAKVAYQQAIALDDGLPELWFNYGNLLKAMGDRTGEMEAFQRAVELSPNFYQAHLNLANVLRDGNAHQAAIAHYQKVIALKPDFPLAYRNLGQLLISLKQFPQAAQVFAAWCRAENNNNPTPLNGLGIALQSQGLHEKAVGAFQKALSLDATRFDSLNNLGTLLRMLKRPHEALPYLQKAVQADPSSDIAQSNLVHTLLGLGRVGDALAQTEAVLQQQPDSAGANLMRGFSLAQQARTAEAIDSFEVAWQQDNSATIAVSNALFTMLYRDDMATEDFVAERQKWVGRLPQSTQRYSQWLGPTEPERRLKVGYLSGDLRSHPVTFFLEPILTNHNPDSIEVYCYDLAGVEDDTTARLKGFAHHWRSCMGTSDDALAAQIHADGIDILVDLSGHTAGNRAGVLLRKPAPIQMLYIGYPGSTGLETVDYIIGDKWVSPPEHADLYTEQILPVEGSFWCFKPHSFAPAPNPLPASQNGYITFGSFNHSTKLSAATMQLWARVLKALPTARLKLKALAMGDEDTCRYFRQQLVHYGADPARLIFEGPTLKIEDFFQAYHTIDIALDPTPYNGGTTTCESLWMGVPVITLKGDRFCSRMSHSLLNHVGMGELSAATPADYVKTAVKLASDLERLGEMRSGLRSRMETSPICQAPQATKSLERAYRTVWRDFCFS